MNRELKERIKLLTLLVLISTSLLQVGILWGYQNHGLPINFLLPFLSSSATNADGYDANDLAIFFRPGRIIVSEGENESHWPVYSKSDDYQKMWDDAAGYLKVIYGREPDKVFYSKDDWYSIISKKSFIFEFRSPIPVDIAAWLLGVENYSWGELSSISRIAIVPWEDVNQNINTIYVYDDNIIYKYSLPVTELAKEDSRLGKDRYQDIINKLKSTRGSEHYKYPAEVLPLPIIRQDMVFSIAAGKSLQSISFNAPSELRTMAKSTGWDSIENVTEKLIGREKDSYERDEDNNGAMVYKNLNNIYKINVSGLLEYKYKTTEYEARGSRVNAFKNAVMMVSSRLGLIEGADMQLTGISEDREGYTFSFDYFINGMPVLMESSAGDGQDAVKSALVIQANGQRVLGCTWDMKCFKPDREAKYNTSLEGVFEKFYIKYPGLKNNKELFFQDIDIGYRITYAKESGAGLEPVWVLRTGDNKYYHIDMGK